MNKLTTFEVTVIALLSVMTVTGVISAVYLSTKIPVALEDVSNASRGIANVTNDIKNVTGKANGIANDVSGSVSTISKILGGLKL